MILQFNIDIKTIRKAYILADLELPSDEEIESILKDTVVDFSSMPKDEDIMNAELGFAMMAIGTANENKDKK